MRKLIVFAAVGIGACGSMVALTGCNVTRTITTTSKYVQRGDTTCVIQTKTIESYDATKKL